MSDEAENTAGKQLKPFEWKPGQSGNPAGRPKGSRNELNKAFTDKVYADFQVNGDAAIVEARETDPVQYLKMIAGLCPKEIKIDRTDEMTDEQLRKRLSQLASTLGVALGFVEGNGGSSGGAEAPQGPDAIKPIQTLQ